MADDGGSAGRLRRFYGVPPPGDLVSCIAALSNTTPLMRDLLTYRFSGDRYGSDNSLPGHKLGNLILVALTSLTGDFGRAVSEMQKIFKTSGRILPSTNKSISIWAKTSVGEKVYREENIDLGRFTGKIESLYIKPPKPSAPKEVIRAIEEADGIIAGPGDLYTTVLPVLLVPEIIKSIKNASAKKIFVVNVANKMFETPEYSIFDYVNAIDKHCGLRIFNYFLANNNLKPKIPKKFELQYQYVAEYKNRALDDIKLIKMDLIDENFPIYHDSKKLAKLVFDTI